LKKFDPMDARVFEAIAAQSGELSPNARDFVVGRLGNVSLDEVLVSFENLQSVGCVSCLNRDVWNPAITNRGKLLYKALANPNYLGTRSRTP
jgi:hypothetical protein